MENYNEELEGYIHANIDSLPQKYQRYCNTLHTIRLNLVNKVKKKKAKLVHEKDFESLIANSQNTNLTNLWEERMLIFLKIVYPLTELSIPAKFFEVILKRLILGTNMTLGRQVVKKFESGQPAYKCKHCFITLVPDLYYAHNIIFHQSHQTDRCHECRTTKMTPKSILCKPCQMNTLQPLTTRLIELNNRIYTFLVLCRKYKLFDVTMKDKHFQLFVRSDSSNSGYVDIPSITTLNPGSVCSAADSDAFDKLAKISTRRYSKASTAASKEVLGVDYDNEDIDDLISIADSDASCTTPVQKSIRKVSKWVEEVSSKKRNYPEQISPPDPESSKKSKLNTSAPPKDNSPPNADNDLTQKLKNVEDRSTLETTILIDSSSSITSTTPTTSNVKLQTNNSTKTVPITTQSTNHSNGVNSEPALQRTPPSQNINLEKTQVVPDQEKQGNVIDDLQMLCEEIHHMHQPIPSSEYQPVVLPPPTPPPPPVNQPRSIPQHLPLNQPVSIFTKVQETNHHYSQISTNYIEEINNIDLTAVQSLLTNIPTAETYRSPYAPTTMASHSSEREPQCAVYSPISPVYNSPFAYENSTNANNYTPTRMVSNHHETLHRETDSMINSNDDLEPRHDRGDEEMNTSVYEPNPMESTPSRDLTSSSTTDTILNDIKRPDTIYISSKGPIKIRYKKEKKIMEIETTTDISITLS